MDFDQGSLAFLLLIGSPRRLPIFCSPAPERFLFYLLCSIGHGLTLQKLNWKWSPPPSVLDNTVIIIIIILIHNYFN
jgi:hypothetical protein